MHTILNSLDLANLQSSLSRELADVDDRQLLDIGLVRLADGSLRAADDPSKAVGTALPQRRFRAFLGALAGFFRWVRSLPLRSPDWRPHFFLRE